MLNTYQIPRLRRPVLIETEISCINIAYSCSMDRALDIAEVGLTTLPDPNANKS